MTTLQSIGFTIAGGLAVCSVAIGVHGVLLSARHSFLAPRATSRPRDVIYNPNPKDPSQNRGGAMIGWITWLLSLPYDTLLRGIPGTGTRRGGLSGSLLKVNLDGIVLLRFHALGLRVSAVASVLLILFVLPMFLSAQCYRLSEDETAQLPACASLAYNLTDYERTTIENVPSIGDAEAFATSLVNAPGKGILARLYFLVIIFYIIIAYLCHQLQQEWIQILAMRRVYYLEADVWKERREELKDTLLFDERVRKKKKKTDKFTFDENKTMSTNKDTCIIDDEKHLLNREPWIPHPEQRDTVPSVGLYSILVGGLPSLPSEAVGAIDTDEIIQFTKRESIDWQLSLTSTFFDHCVPNQPGFSSSVAAVTIMPSASELSVAWKKWYKAAAKLRRLKFIRQEITKRRQFTVSAPKDEEAVQAGSLRERTGSHQSFQLGDTPRQIYADITANKHYFRQVLGSLSEQEEDCHLVDALNFGPEQTAVYSREFAQAAAPCCPNGTCEGKITSASIDELLDLEQEAAEDLHRANEELRLIRHKVSVMQAATTTPPSGELVDEAREDDEVHGTGAGHRRVKSAMEAAMPTMLGTETELYRKQSSTAKKGTSKRERKSHRTTKSNDGQNKLLDVSQLNYASFASPDGSDGHPLLRERRHTVADPENIHVHSTSQLSFPNIPEDSPIDGSARILFAQSKKYRRPSPVNEIDTDEEDNDEEKGLLSSQWNRVSAIVNETKENDRSSQRVIADGTWKWPSMNSLFGKTKKGAKNIKKWAQLNSAKAVEQLARESTYAVVTFTSRQAAVAARHCLADGRGTLRWDTSIDVPIPPLADAAAFDLITFRNCCRPVSLSISDRQKLLRNYCAMALLGTTYTLYSFPLTFAAAAVGDPKNLREIFPNIADWADDTNLEVFNLISGLLSAMVWTIFFASCPVIFKSIANFGSKATSAINAEFKALQYYWWFMVVTAFSGVLITNMILYGFSGGVQVGSNLITVLRDIASTIPGTVAPTWLNWIIFRFLIILPLNYLLQWNTFAFQALGCRCCARLTVGGGPGGPVPYRIYVDSGVVLMCTLALGTASPLIAPASFFYFLFWQPLLRRNLIFVWRPKFDGGGLRFPFIFDMTISMALVASILLATQLALKQALGPAVAAALTFIPIILFRSGCHRQYLPAFQDAALLQTSLLDGWDLSEDTSMQRREEFRRFLVDAHKAAYVPVCIAGTDTNDMLTAEPALVVPLDSDPDRPKSEHISFEEITTPISEQNGDEVSPFPTLPKKTSQHGATLRRAVRQLNALHQFGAMRRRLSSVGGTNSDFVRSMRSLSEEKKDLKLSSRSLSLMLDGIPTKDDSSEQSTKNE